MNKPKNKQETTQISENKQIIYLNPKDLKKLQNNPRSISTEQFKALRKSIKNNPDYFAARPLILSDRTNELVIIAGNQRYEAAIAEGLEKVPTILLRNLSERKEREIIIRDNAASGSWDYDALANDWDINDLEDWGAPLPMDWEEKEPKEKEEKMDSLEAKVIIKCLKSQKEGFTDWLRDKLYECPFETVMSKTK